MPLRNLLRVFEFICLVPNCGNYYYTRKWWIRALYTCNKTANETWNHKRFMKNALRIEDEYAKGWKLQSLNSKHIMRRALQFSHSVVNIQQFSNTFSAVIFRNLEKPKGKITIIIIIIMEINEIPQTNVTKLKRAATSILRLNEKSYSPGLVCLPH